MQPTLVRARVCRSRICPDVDTRAYPISAPVRFAGSGASRPSWSAPTMPTGVSVTLRPYGNAVPELLDTPASQHLFQAVAACRKSRSGPVRAGAENRSILDTTGLAHAPRPRWTLNGSNSPVPALTPLAVHCCSTPEPGPPRPTGPRAPKRQTSNRLKRAFRFRCRPPPVLHPARHDGHLAQTGSGHASGSRIKAGMSRRP